MWATMASYEHAAGHPRLATFFSVGIVVPTLCRCGRWEMLTSARVKTRMISCQGAMAAGVSRGDRMRLSCHLRTKVETCTVCLRACFAAVFG